MSSEKPKDPILPVVLTLLLLAAGFGAYFYWIETERAASRQVAEAPTTDEEPEPPVRHPVQPAPANEAKPLPSLAESDEALQESATGLAGEERLDRLFYLNNVVRRVVVTIDALPREKVARRYNIAKPVAGKFLVQGEGDNVSLHADNYKRYAAYARLAESLDTEQLVKLYVHFYPLFQQEYENLGYRNKYFNDRVIEVIDNLLATPEVIGRIELRRPKVMYVYADSELEALSAGQKMMLRMGPENAARIKAKLKEIRQALASAQ